MTYSLNAIKGRVAETIIQEMFLAQGLNVFHYGMERSIPGVSQLTRKTTGHVKEQISSMPDFVVQNPKTDKLYFVEVKYRASGKFSIKDLSPNYPWPHSYFIVLSKTHTKCLTYKLLMEGNSISPECSNLLVKRKDLGLDKKLILNFMAITQKIFTGV